jgi:hypothetical protein
MGELDMVNLRGRCIPTLRDVDVPAQATFAQAGCGIAADPSHAMLLD